MSPLCLTVALCILRLSLGLWLQEYGIQGFPTIKLFTPTSKTPLDYQGAREAKPIVDYALSQVPALMQPSVLSRLFSGHVSLYGESAGASKQRRCSSS